MNTFDIILQQVGLFVIYILAGLLLVKTKVLNRDCLLYTSPSPRDGLLSRMPSSA